MTTINTNLNSLIAQRVLKNNNKGLQTNLERLSTGLRINRGSDDPAGLIASENLRAEKTAIMQAIANGERAERVITIAEGGLTEVQDQLRELEALTSSAASHGGLSAEERKAIQLQVDSILGSIDRIADQTSFQSIKLLNGSFEFNTSGVRVNEFDEVQVNAALLPTDTSTMVMNIKVAQSAQTALAMISTDGAGLNGFSGQTVTFEITGSLGTMQFAFASGTNATEAVQSINEFSEITGVSAAQSGSGIVLQSKGVGTNEFVTVRHIEGDAYESRIHFDDGTGTAVSAIGTRSGRDEGRDAAITINGIRAHTQGLVASLSQAHLDLEFRVDSGFNQNGNVTSFVIRGGGAKFSLSPRASLGGKARIGIAGVSTGTLGSSVHGRLASLKSGGTANVLNGDVDRAQRIIDSAIRQVSVQRGQLGSFIANTVQTSINSLNIAFENTAAAESVIRDTDFAHETAELTRSQVLVQAATNILSIANSQPQSALALLGG